MTLHCVYSASAFSAGAEATLSLEQGDAVLLLGSAIVLAEKDVSQIVGQTFTETRDTGTKTGTGTGSLETVIKPLSRIRVFALADDLDAHGIRCSNHVMRIDYDGWVALTQEHSLQQVWA